MRKYEIMFVVKPDLEETNISATASSMKDVLTNHGAKIVDEKVMGQRELAYEINKNNTKYKTGYYFLYVIEADEDAAIREFDRVAEINENIIRHLIVRVEEK